MRTITIGEFHAELKAHLTALGTKDLAAIAFRCPACNTVQNAHDLFAAGVGGTFGEVEKFLAYSCIGRWTNAGPATRESKPQEGKHGCDWTLGGLLRIQELIVVGPDGEEHPRFELATPGEAKDLLARQVLEGLKKEAKHESGR